MKVEDIAILDLHTKRGLCDIPEKYHQCLVKIKETNRKNALYPIRVQVIEDDVGLGVYSEMLNDAVEFKLREFLEIL